MNEAKNQASLFTFLILFKYFFFFLSVAYILRIIQHHHPLIPLYPSTATTTKKVNTFTNVAIKIAFFKGYIRVASDGHHFFLPTTHFFLPFDCQLKSHMLVVCAIFYKLINEVVIICHFLRAISFILFFNRFKFYFFD